MNRLYRTEAGRWLLSLATTLALFLIAYTTLPVVYLTNDDSGIRDALAGYRTVTPYANHQFINTFFGLPLSLLYAAIPGVPWYTVYHVAALLLGITVIGACVLGECGRSGVPSGAALASIAAADAILFLHSVANMSFTVTPAVVGAAAIALTLTFDFAASGKARLARAAPCLLLLLLSFLHRQATGSVALCFWGLAAAYAALSRRPAAEGRAGRRALAQVAGFAALTAALLVSATVVDGRVKEAENGEAFREYDALRAAFMDYPHARYDENPELYRSLGWDREFYNAASNWFFMDERFDSRSLSAIVRPGTAPDVPLKRRVSDALWRGWSLFNDIGVARAALVFIGTLSLVWLLALLAGAAKGRLEPAFAACALAGCGALCCYLCWNGRFILRAFQTVAIPTAIVVLLLLPRALDVARVVARWRASGRARILLGAAGGAAVAGLSFACALILADAYDGEAVREKRALLGETDTLERYAVAHPGDLFIHDQSLTRAPDPFETYDGAVPYNVIFWGGSGMFSGMYRRQLAANGLTELRADAFRRENVYYVTKSGSRYSRLLLPYMKKRFGVVGSPVVRALGSGVEIRRFEFPEGSAPAR